MSRISMQLGFIDRTPRGRVGTDRVRSNISRFRRRPPPRRDAERSVLKTTFLGLGSNVGDREANLRDAVERLDWRTSSRVCAPVIAV